MARLDTIRALERRGLSPNLAEKVVDLGYLLGTLKKSDLKTVKKDFQYKEILQLKQEEFAINLLLVKLFLLIGQTYLKKKNCYYLHTLKNLMSLS